jgi:hypothetical protein
MVRAKIAAAFGTSALMTRRDGRWQLITDDEANALREAGRADDVEHVYLEAPDPDALAWLVDQCDPALQDTVAIELRRIAGADFMLGGEGSTTPPTDRQLVGAFFAKNSPDAASSVREEDATDVPTRKAGKKR